MKKRFDFDKLSVDEKKAYIEAFSYKDPQKEREKTAFITKGWPKKPSHFIAGALGLPIERNSRKIKHPLTIYSFIFLFIIIHFLGTSTNHLAFVETWGFVAKDFERSFFLTFVTSFFLHGSWFHLIGNAYYFYVFGDDVEDDMDLFSFLSLLIGGHIFAIILHGFLAGRADVPLIGASAGISALLGYYMIRFPKRQISYMVFFFFIWIHIPAFLAFLWKFAWEFFLATTDSVAYQGVALWAHVGGGFFGVVYALLRTGQSEKKEGYKRAIDAKAQSLKKTDRKQSRSYSRKSKWDQYNKR